MLLTSALLAFLVPSNAEILRAHRVAERYWHGTPSCGRVHVEYEAMPGDQIGLAEPRDCLIILAYQTWAWPQTCRAYVHEYGHLVLGVSHFQNLNPSNPAHSPDPYNIMYGDAPSASQELTQERRIGCFKTDTIANKQHTSL